MSFPNVPSQSPTISLSLAQTVPLLLDSIAFEELALAHLLNAEAEKVQFVIGTLTPTSVSLSPPVVSISNLLDVNTSVRKTLQDVIKKEMLLEFKFENVLDLIQAIPISGITPTPPVMFTCAGNCDLSSTARSTAPPSTVIASFITGTATGDLSLEGTHICNQCHEQGSHFSFHFGGTGTTTVNFDVTFMTTDILSYVCTGTSATIVANATIHSTNGFNQTENVVVMLTPTSYTITSTDVNVTVPSLTSGSTTFTACP